MFKSKFEENVHKELVKADNGFSVDYETEKFEYTLVKHYTPDFIITRPDGTKCYIETKGKFDLDSRQKMIACKSQHPDKEFVILFMRDQPLTKKSKLRYTDWAEKYGFDYSVNCIPYRWLMGTLTPANLIKRGIIIDPTAKYLQSL